MIQENIIRYIAEKAFLPEEWCSLNRHTELKETDEAISRILAEKWEKQLTLGKEGQGLFDLRLESLGLDRKNVQSWLKNRCFPEDTPLPFWADFLARALDKENYVHPDVTVKCLFKYSDQEKRILNIVSQKQPLFPQFLHPFVTQALKEIDEGLEKTGPDCRSAVFLSDPHVRAQIGRYLVSRLSRASARTVSYEIRQPHVQDLLNNDLSNRVLFNKNGLNHESCSGSESFDKMPGLEKTGPEKRYDYYVSKILGTGQGLLDFYKKYPVLARIHALYSLDFIAFITEVISALSRDIKKIEKAFFKGKDSGRLMAFQPGLSDPHNCGKTVCCLEFSSGLKVIYKPRSLKIDQAWNSLVEWVNQLNPGLPLYKSRILDMAEYGWAEFIEEKPCTALNEAASYFKRQGMHTGIFHLLCGEDFHYGNFISHGEFPVPVDLEGLMAPGLHVIPEQWADMEPDFYPTSFTVLSSAMLPGWRAGDPELPFYEASGVNGGSSRKWPRKIPVWENIGTDSIRLRREFNAKSEYECRPVFKGERPSVEHFMTELTAGFKQACELFIENREFLLSDKSPLQKFKGVEVRCMVRDTNDYVNTLFWGTAPDHLVSGSAFSVSLETVFRREAKFGIADKPCEYEKSSLIKGDIPIFTGCTDSCSLFIDNNMYIEDIGVRDSFAQVMQRLSRLSTEEIEWQIQLLQAAFQMSFQKAGDLECLKKKEQNKEGFIKQASLIGDALERQALKHKDTATWLNLVRLTETETSVCYAPVDPFLHSGTAGTALFFANLYYVVQDKKYKDLAFAALAHSLKIIEKLKTVPEYVMPFSSFTGLSGIIYSLTETGRLTGDEFLFDKALYLALSMKASVFSGAFKQFGPDVMSGSAGIILCLLHLYKYRPDEGLITMCEALACGILDCSEGCFGENGWNVTGFKRPLTGMAHGAAGISLALSRLASVLPECTAHRGDPFVLGPADLERAVKNSILFENSHFCDTNKDWIDLQSSAENSPSFMHAWCTGAPGIGMARLYTKCSDHDLELSGIIKQDIHRAAKATQKQMHSSKRHHLCCGETGRIQFILQAGLRTEHHEYAECAVNSGLNMIDYYMKKGFWRFHSCNERSVFSSLMSGASGIGLTFLKLADPENTSNILAFC